MTWIELREDAWLALEIAARFAPTPLGAGAAAALRRATLLETAQHGRLRVFGCSALEAEEIARWCDNVARLLSYAGHVGTAAALDTAAVAARTGRVFDPAPRSETRPLARLA